MEQITLTRAHCSPAQESFTFLVIYINIFLYSVESECCDTTVVYLRSTAFRRRRRRVVHSAVRPLLRVSFYRHSHHRGRRTCEHCTENWLQLQA